MTLSLWNYRVFTTFISVLLLTIRCWIVVIWCSVCVLLWIAVFAITIDMRKLIAICFSVHRIWEILSMRCLIHCWSRSCTNATSLTWIFVWATMVDSVMLLSMIWMMWLRSTSKMVVIFHTTVLNWVRSVHAVHYVWKIAWTINCLADIWAVVHCWIGDRLACWVLNWWMAWVRLRVACWWWRARVVLRIAWIALSCIWSLVWATHVILFTALWANSSEPSKSWWSLVMIIVVGWLSNWTSVLRNLIIRI